MQTFQQFKNFLILLGKQILKIRRGKGISLKELSDKTGIRLQYLKKIENGTAYGVLINKHLGKIADNLEVKIEALLDFKY